MSFAITLRSLNLYIFFSEYKEFNSRLSSSLDEVSTVVKSVNDKESQMDKIKFTLDDLQLRIESMTKKFRQYSIKTKRSARTRADSDFTTDDGEGDLDDEDENGSMVNLVVYVKDNGHGGHGELMTFQVNKTVKVKTLKSVLLNKVPSGNFNVDDLILSVNGNELTNDNFTLEDYNIGPKSSITLEFDQR